MARENVESAAFRQVYDKLCTGIRPALADLVNATFAKELIPDSTVSEATNLSMPVDAKTQTFLHAVLDRIRADPSAFHTFVGLLGDQYSMEYLATMLKKSLEDLKKRQTKVAENDLSQRDEMIVRPYHRTLPFAASARLVSGDIPYAVTRRAITPDSLRRTSLTGSMEHATKLFRKTHR